MTAALLAALAIAFSPVQAVPDGGLLRIQATTAFDGTWSGTGTLTQRRGRGTSCGPDTVDRRFIIQNGQISFDYEPRVGISFSGPIQPNGSFDIASGSNRFQGQVTGSDMAATFTGSQCIRSFQMRRRRN